jgi:putative autotransporter adhesin-like protein
MKTAALAALLLAAAPASASAAERNYSVTSFDRIRVDGPYQVTLKTNVAPFARASGTQASLDGVSTKVEGRTLIVRTNTSAGWGGYPGEGRGPVTIELGTHDLSTAWVNGAGALFIDKVKGLSFDLAIQGAGVMRIDSADVDQLRVGLSGSASSRLAGRAARLTATVRGTSSLDAESLAIKDAVIGAEGPAMVRASVSGTAKVDALGLASVALTGGPSCTTKTQGSATVTGCR